MPEYQEATKFYLVSSLLLDITSKVLSRTLDGICSRLNTAFEPLLNLNRHKFFHLWKSEPCCQCDDTPEVNNNTVHFRDSDWVHLYQQFQRPCQKKQDVCSCCYRALPGIQPSSIDFSLATDVLIGLKSLHQNEAIYITQIRNYEPELKQMQNTRLGDRNLDSPIPEQWKEILGTLRKLAIETKEGYWENLKEVKEIHQHLAVEDDETDKKVLNDKDRDEAEHVEEEVVLREDFTPKDDQKSLADSAYCSNKSEHNLEKSIAESEDRKSVTRTIDDVDSTCFDDSALTSSQGHLSDRYRDIKGSRGTTWEEDIQETGRGYINREINRASEEQKHGLLLSEMRGKCQYIARRCAHVSKDVSNLRRFLKGPSTYTTPTYKHLPSETQIADDIKQNERHTRDSWSSRYHPSISVDTQYSPTCSVNVDSSYPGHRKVPLTNEEFNTLIQDSYNCLMKSKATLTTSPLDADDKFVYSSSAKEYVRWLDARTSDYWEYEDTTDNASGHQTPANTDKHYDEPDDNKQFDKEAETEEKWTVAEPQQTAIQDEDWDDKPVRYMRSEPDMHCQKWIEESSPFTLLQTRDIQFSEFSHETAYDASRGHDDNHFYRRCTERCEAIRQRSASIRQELEITQSRMRVLQHRENSLMDLSCLSADTHQMEDDFANINRSRSPDFHSIHSKSWKRTSSPLATPRSDTSFATTEPSKYKAYARSSTPITRGDKQSYVDKYAAWLSDSVKRTKEDPVYGRKHKVMWGTVTKISPRDAVETSILSNFEPDKNVFDDEVWIGEDCLDPSFEPYSALHDGRFSPDVAESPLWDFARLNEKDDRSVHELTSKERESLLEENNFGLFLKTSKQNLHAMKERSLQTRREIEKLRSQLLSS